MAEGLQDCLELHGESVEGGAQSYEERNARNPTSVSTKCKEAMNALIYRSCHTVYILV